MTLKWTRDLWRFRGTLTENHHLPGRKNTTLRETLPCNIMNSYLAFPKGLVSTLETALLSQRVATPRPGFHLPPWHTFVSHTACWEHYKKSPFLIRFAFSKGILLKPLSASVSQPVMLVHSYQNCVPQCCVCLNIPLFYSLSFIQTKNINIESC